MLQAESAVAQQPKRSPGTARLLIGTSGRGSKGVYVSYFHNGKLEEPTLAVEAANPSFLATPNSSFPHLFAVTQPENQPSHATSFTHPPMSDRPGEQLQRIGDAASEHPGGCHVGVSPDGHSVFVANYGGANVASFHADEKGQLTLASSIHFPPDGHGPNPDRQKQSYVHSTLASPDGNFVFVNDLGLDRIHIFRLDRATAKLTTHGEWKSAPGAGPRHLAVHPNGEWVYCINELNSTVNLLHWDKKTGTLTTVGTPVPTLPSGVDAAGKRACELAFSRDLRFLYASNRVDESFTVFTIAQQTGTLTVLQHLPNPGKESRHIAISPDGKFLLSANQFSDDISVHPIDAATGKLADRTATVKLGGPSCLLFG